jgi:P27 family predicted phage terminase small subunit
MGLRGPKPKPTAVLRLAGSWRAERNRREPKIPAGIPKPPAWLDAPGRAVWRSIAPILGESGVLTRIDRESLGRYCDAMIRWRAAAEFLRKHGDVYPIKDADGNLKCMVQFPQVSIYNKLGMVLLRLEQEFGMTPSSRSRVQVPDDGKGDNEKTARFVRAG